MPTLIMGKAKKSKGTTPLCPSQKSLSAKRMKSNKTRRGQLKLNKTIKLRTATANKA